MRKVLYYFKKLKKEDRIMFFLIFTTIGNFCIAIIKFVLSLTLPSLWFFMNALFMIILSFARFFSIRDYVKTKAITDDKEVNKIGHKNYLNNSLLLVILGIMYFFINVYTYITKEQVQQYMNI